MIWMNLNKATMILPLFGKGKSGEPQARPEKGPKTFGVDDKASGGTCAVHVPGAALRPVRD
jgi:hypothetical protein